MVSVQSILTRKRLFFAVVIAVGVLLGFPIAPTEVRAQVVQIYCKNAATLQVQWCNLTPVVTPSPSPSPTPLAANVPTPVPTATALPNTYYVSPTGSDSNAGTCPATSAGCTGPFLTIEKAAFLVTAGQTVVIAGGTYTFTASSNTSLCAVGCGAFLSHTGTNGSHVRYQCQTYKTCVMNGTSPTTGSGYAFLAGNSVSYTDFIGFDFENWKWGAESWNGGSSGSSFGNTNMTFSWNTVNNTGFVGILAGEYSHDDTITNNSFSNIGSYVGYNRVCPNTNASDHALYLQDHNYTIENNTFSTTDCGWYLQAAFDTPGGGTGYKMIGNSFGPRNPVAPSTAGLVVLYQGILNTTPGIDFENNAVAGSVGAYLHCFSQTAAGNPTIIESHNAFGDNSPLIDCGGTYSYTAVGNLHNLPIGFLVASPVNQSDFQIHNTSILCNAGAVYSGWTTDIVGLARPLIFALPDMGAYSCNSY